jgi:hypothetical protein
MERALFALADFQNFSAVEIAVGDPDLATPSFGYDSDRLSCTIHGFRHFPERVEIIATESNARA